MVKFSTDNGNSRSEGAKRNMWENGGGGVLDTTFAGGKGGGE